MYPSPVVSSTVEAHFVGQTAANIIALKVQSILEENSTCLIGLSGSSSLHNMYALLGQNKQVEWRHVTFFAVDETFVPGNPLRSGSTLAAAKGSFTGSRFVFPNVKIAGVAECCRQYENELENLLQLPDIVIVTVEEGIGARCAGYGAPIPSDAFDKERLAVVNAHHFSESIPYTISASISFLQRTKNTFFVLPRVVQADTFEKTILIGLDEERLVDRANSYAALSLFATTGGQTHIVSAL